MNNFSLHSFFIFITFLFHSIFFNINTVKSEELIEDNYRIYFNYLYSRPYNSMKVPNIGGGLGLSLRKIYEKDPKGYLFFDFNKFYNKQYLTQDSYLFGAGINLKDMIYYNAGILVNNWKANWIHRTLYRSKINLDYKNNINKLWIDNYEITYIYPKWNYFLGLNLQYSYNFIRFDFGYKISHTYLKGDIYIKELSREANKYENPSQYDFDSSFNEFYFLSIGYEY